MISAWGMSVSPTGRTRLRWRPASAGELATVPIDVVKVRMQLDGQGGGAKKYPSALQAFPTIVREEGFGALYKGVQPALLRQATYGSVRIGLYEPVKTGIAALLGQGGAAAGGQQQQPSFLHKALSGIVCGALSAGGFTPMDVVKIRMQADGMLPAAAAPPPAAATAASSSLAVGVGAGATHVASSARHGGSSTSAAAAAGAAAAARGVATAAAAPAVPASAAAASAKTAASAAAAAAASSVLRAPRYRNVFHAFAEIGRTEGLRGLYKGVSPTVQRAGEERRVVGQRGIWGMRIVLPLHLCTLARIAPAIVCASHLCSCRRGGGAVILRRVQGADCPVHGAAEVSGDHD